MKLLFQLITALLLINISIEEKESTSSKIVGSFFSNIYSCEDLDKDISLVSEIPKEYYSGETEYKSEYDVNWKFDFLENGEIKTTPLFAYYCGHIAIMEKGQWKKVGKNSYLITFQGLCYGQIFSKQKKYSIADSGNGIRMLIIEK